MSLLSELVDGASGGAPVANLLRRVKVLGARMDVGPLEEWVDHELMGYPGEAALPSYRGPFRTEVLGHFSGPFYSALQNGLIPAVGFPEEFREGPLFHVEFRQAMAELEVLGGGDDLRAMWPADVVALTNTMIQRGEVRLYEGMGLQQAWRVIPSSQVRAIVDTVRTRILDLALSLERTIPQAGEPNAPVPSPEAVQTIVTNIYGGASNVAIASSMVDQRIELPPRGDRAALMAYLRSLGIGEADLGELDEALDRDSDQGEGSTLGQHTSSWLGRLMVRAGELGLAVGAGAGGDLIARALASHLGLSS